MKDLAGNTLEVGQWVVRAFNLGRCAALKFSYIVSLEKGVGLVSAVLEDSFLRGSYWHVGQGTMKFPDRTLVVDKAQVPDAIISAVEDYTKGKK